jgi:hypothetical protein
LSDKLRDIPQMGVAHMKKPHAGALGINGGDGVRLIRVQQNPELLIK